MKKILALICLFILSCGRPDHEKERQDVCQHSEGSSASDCNAGDDFSPDTCLMAMNNFEDWWRDDVQTSINNCLISSACYTQAEEVPGPSIEVPLQLCLQTELITSLRPTDSEKAAAASFCTKAKECAELGDYTISQCEEILLNPFDDGQLFLMMNDQVASDIEKCNTSLCADFDDCVFISLYTAGVYNSIINYNIKMPKLIKNMKLIEEMR